MLQGGQTASVEFKIDMNEKYMEEFEQRLGSNLQRASEYFISVMKSAVPVDTGTLKSTMKSRKLRATKRNPAGGHKLDAQYYLFFYEYGTLNEDGSERQKAKPITNPLLAQNEERLTQIITQGL